MKAIYLHLTAGGLLLMGRACADAGADTTPSGPSYSIDRSSDPNPAYSIPSSSTSENPDSILFPAPAAKPKPETIRISPGTIREGFDYKNSLKSIVTLSAPASVDFLCHVVSSDPGKLVCSDILVPKGSLESEGQVKINWEKIDRDCRVGIKAYDPNNPLNATWCTVSIRKDTSQAAAPTPSP